MSFPSGQPANEKGQDQMNTATTQPSGPQQPPPAYVQAVSTQQPNAAFYQYGQNPAAMQPQMMQQQPYMFPMIAIPPRPPLLPREMQPNDFMVVTIVVTIVCGIFNITSLLFSIPALICSVMAFERRSSGVYSTAKQLGIAAIILDMLCIAWVGIGGVVTVGTLAACSYGSLCYYY